MTVVSDHVVAAMRDVPEPCSIAMRTPTDIVEMGLVGDVRVERGHVTVELVLTDPSCAHFRSMGAYIRDVVGRLDGVDSVEVLLSTTTLWTPDRMRRRQTTP
jgi:metal-sulfur cluster biosynthetic enzyme